MPETQTDELPRVPEAFADLAALLADPLPEDAGNWLATVAQHKAFYVRGYTWYGKNVSQIVLLENDRKITPLVKKMKYLVKSRPAWQNSGLNWGGQFSYRKQVREALGFKAVARQPQFFSKAVQTLAFCEAQLITLHKSGKIEIHPYEMYDHMKIQAATYYISNFSSVLFEDLKAQTKNLVSLLLTRTHQVNPQVFDDMAAKDSGDGHIERKTVTRNLAIATKSAIEELCAGVDLGPVTSIINPVQGVNPASSEHIEF